MSFSGIGSRAGLVLGAGGTLGGVWTIAILHELGERLGWTPADAEIVVGTSAGSELAALLATRVSPAQLLAAALGSRDADPRLVARFADPPAPYPPRPRLGMTAPGLARHLPSLLGLSGLLPIGGGDASFLDRALAGRGEGAWPARPAPWIVAVDVETGERVAFGAPGAPRATLREAVRASWAIPGWFPPVAIGGRRYLDGGVVSPTSADLLAESGLDTVIVIAPMASTDQGRRHGLARVEGAMRAVMRRALDAEVALLRGAGIRVVRIEPGPEDLDVIGPNLMDGARRHAVLECSLRTARRTVAAALTQAPRPSLGAYA
jgi:NTE family protein